MIINDTKTVEWTTTRQGLNFAILSFFGHHSIIMIVHYIPVFLVILLAGIGKSGVNSCLVRSSNGVWVDGLICNHDWTPVAVTLLSLIKWTEKYIWKLVNVDRVLFYQVIPKIRLMMRMCLSSRERLPWISFMTATFLSVFPVLSVKLIILETFVSLSLHLTAVVSHDSHGTPSLFEERDQRMITSLLIYFDSTFSLSFWRFLSSIDKQVWHFLVTILLPYLILRETGSFQRMILQVSLQLLLYCSINTIRHFLGLYISCRDITITVIIINSILSWYGIEVWKCY